MNVAIKDKQLELLIGLQEIDQEIQKLASLKEKIPGEIERERQIFDKINSEIEQIKEKTEQAVKERRSRELETGSIKDQLIRTKEKLPDVRTNKEYSALLQEIENLKGKIIELEEKEIELMECIEEIEKGSKIKLEEKNAEEKKFFELKKRKEGELDKLNKLLEDELSKRNEFSGNVETKWLKHYKKVVNSRQGLAVIALYKGACGGCNQSIRPQLAIEIRQNNTIIICPYCSRFLFSEKLPE